MAHRIGIPADYQAVSPQRRYSIVIANISGWCSSLSAGFRGVNVRILCPEYARRFTVKAGFSALPENVQKALPKWEGKIGREVRDMQFEVISCRPIFPTSPYVEIDAWDARKEFFDTPRSMEHLLAFLDRFGAWDEKSGTDNSINDDDKPGILFPDAMWQIQRELGKALTGEDEQWLLSELPRWKFGSKKEFPHFVLSDFVCLDAIKSSITIDLLKGLEFGICKRNDCGKVFERSDPRKTYCSHDCGHLVSVRKIRREKLALKRKLGKKQ